MSATLSSMVVGYNLALIRLRRFQAPSIMQAANTIGTVHKPFNFSKPCNIQENGTDATTKKARENQIHSQIRDRAWGLVGIWLGSRITYRYRLLERSAIPV